MRSRGPPSASSTVSRDAAEADSARSFASAAGPSPSDVSARIRAPGCRCGRTRSSVRPCSESSTVCGSDQPSRAAARLNADGAGTHDHLARIDLSRQHRADAVVERIARGEHADLPAAMAQHLVGRAVERARPRPRRAANERRRQAEMAPAAEHDFRRADQPARRRAQALDAVLADADDGQPARRCGSLALRAHQEAACARVLILGGTTEARSWAERLARRADLDVTLSLAGRTASPVPQPVPIRIGGFGGAAGLADYLAAERIDALIDATHPYASVISANAAAAARKPACRSWRCAGRPGSRSPATAGSKCDDARAAVQRASGRQPRSVFVALGRNELAPFAGAPQHRYLIRSVDPVDPPLPLPHVIYITARGPFSEADDRALMTDARDRSRHRQEQRRQPRPTARSPRRARSAST